MPLTARSSGSTLEQHLGSPQVSSMSHSPAMRRAERQASAPLELRGSWLKQVLLRAESSGTLSDAHHVSFSVIPAPPTKLSGRSPSAAMITQAGRLGQ